MILLVLMLGAYATYGQRAIFMYENAGSAGKSGNLSFYDTEDKQLFSVSASAGYKDDAQNPYSQGLKNKGPIPAGKWYIYKIKNHDKSILRLKPDEDVNVLDRDGFLIHGFADGSNPVEASKGCIILGPVERKILRDAFISGGKKKILITVMPIVSGNQG